MSSNIGTAYVQIVPEASGISGKMEQAIGPSASRAGVSAGQKISSNIGSTMQKVGGTMMKAGAIATAVSVPIIAGIKQAMSSYQIQNAAETKLTEIYKTRMGVTEKAAKKTMEYASALQKTGVVGDEVQLSGAQQLATFAKTPKTVNALLPAMNNLLVQQKGLNGTEQDATNIANMMGKVMQGQVGALKRVGISFDENSEKILKNGTEEERAAELAKVITSNVGEMNKTMANTPEGKIQQMKNAFGDLQEQIGASLAPVLADVAKWIGTNLMPKIQGLIKFLKSNPVVAKIVVAIAGLLAVGGPLLIILGAIVSSVGALLPVITAISAPVLAVVGIIVAVITVLTTAYAKNEEFRKAVNNLVKSVFGAVKKLIAAVMPTVKSIIKIIGSLINEIAKALAPCIKAVTPIITKAIELVAKVFKKLGPIISKVLKFAAGVITTFVKAAAIVFVGLVKKITSIWDKITSVIGKAVNWIKKNLSFSSIGEKVRSAFSNVFKFITTPFRKAKEFLGGVIKKIKGFFPLKIPNFFKSIKLPHFKINGGKLPWGIGGKGKAPSISVKWYAKGGVFDRPNIIGVGEAGREAVVPLQGKQMMPFAKAIASQMQGSGSTYNIGDVTLDVKDLKDITTLEQFVAIVKRAKAFA